MEGYNTAIEYRGVKLMVQTQDKGPDFNYVESLIYLAGRVIATKRRAYTQICMSQIWPQLSGKI